MNKNIIRILYLLFSAVFFYFIVYKNFSSYDPSGPFAGFDKMFLFVYSIINIIFFLFGVGILKTNKFSNISLILSSILLIIHYILPWDYYTTLHIQNIQIVFLINRILYSLNPYVFWPISVVLLIIGAIVALREKFSNKLS